MVRISELKFCITAGVQNTVAPRDQKLGVRERFFFLHFKLYAYECCITKLICVR